MSDLNSSVRDEQIDDANSVADNMETLHPAPLETPGPEVTDVTPVDPAEEADHDAAFHAESEESSSASSHSRFI